MKRFGIITTSIYLLVIVIWIYFDWSRFHALKPNEWGDFLAGVFGPLALFWVVLGFWLQSHELQNSVRALEMQSAELKSSVEQQTALVGVSKQQLSLEIEKREHEAARSEKEWMEQLAPRFMLTASGGSSSMGTHTRKFKVINRGGDARKVNFVSFRAEDLNLKIAPKARHNILNGTEFEISLQAAQPIEKIDGLELAVDLIGNENIIRKQIFHFENGQFVETATGTHRIQDQQT